MKKIKLFLSYFECFKLTPRLGRVKYFILTTFWDSILFILLGLVCLVGFTLISLTPDKLFKEFLLNIGIGGVFIAAFFSVIISALNQMALKIRRLHDLDLNGLWLLLLIIPWLNLFFFLGLWFVKGSEGDNRFGAAPPNPTKKEQISLIFMIPIAILFLVAIYSASILGYGTR